jgi:hypothetical protein
MYCYFDEKFFPLSMYVDLLTVYTAELAPSGIPITGQLVPLCTRFFVIEILAQHDVISESGVQPFKCVLQNVLSEPNSTG